MLTEKEINLIQNEWCKLKLKDPFNKVCTKELENDILAGSKQIYNHAQNPSTDPDIDTDMELQYINDQNVTKNKKGKLEGYALLWQILVSDVTETFLNKFKSLFLTVVQPELPLLYETEIEDND